VKFSKKMKAVIEQLTERFAVDIYKSGAHLKVELGGYMPLCIENIGWNRISVAHYFEQNGDLVADPDIVFFVESGEWAPIQITQVFGFQNVVRFDENNELKIVSYKPRSQAGVNALANQWAQNIKDQGWLKDGTVVVNFVEVEGSEVKVDES